MSCQRCGETEGNTRDHVYKVSLLKKHGRNNRIFGETNIQRLCRECHDIKEQQWVQHKLFVDYREREEYEELIELLKTFRLPTQFVVHGLEGEKLLEPWGNKWPQG